mgnify:CR=1 FL=1
MNMDKNDSFDGLLQEGRHTTLRSFSWGNREFTISSDKISLYVGAYPMTRSRCWIFSADPE